MSRPLSSLIASSSALSARSIGPEPRLPGDLELGVGRRRPRLEVPVFGQLLERDPERSDVLDQGVLGGHSRGDADRPVPREGVDRDLGEPGHLVERLVERQVADVEIEGGIGHLGAELLAQIGDGVAGLLLELLDRLAEPDPLGLDRHLACPGLRFLSLLLERCADFLEPLLPLLAGDAGRIGKEGQDLAAQLDQSGLGVVPGLRLGVVEPLQELEHPIAKCRVSRLGLGREGLPGRLQQEPQGRNHDNPEGPAHQLSFSHGSVSQRKRQMS